LKPDEVLLWTGSPYRGIERPHPWFAATTNKPFFWVVIGLGIVVGFLKFYQASPKIAATLVIFGFIGILLDIVFFAPNRRRGFYYALTDQRAIVITNQRKATPQSVQFRDIVSLDMDEFAPGLGTITCFASGDPGWGSVSRQMGTEPLPLFDSIADAPAVYAVLHRLVAVTTSASSGYLASSTFSCWRTK
jgi:hypothetical protein